MKYAIFATARNEKFIIEWVNYYIRLGFNYFIVYDDLSDKPIQEVFEENNIDKVIYKIYRNNSHANLYDNLHQAFTQHISNSNMLWKNTIIPELLQNNIDFVFQIDIDEFLFLNNFKNIDNLVQNYMPLDVLKINWLLFGSNNIFNNTSDSIINTFNKSETKLCKATGGLKSLTRVSKIHMEETQYGPHCLPILKNSIVKDIFNNIIPCYDKITEATPFLSKNDSYSNNIYIAHYACQDLKTFVKRKFTNKNNVQWMLSNFIKFKTRKEAYDCVDFIDSNFHDFTEYFYLKKNKLTNEKTNKFEEKLTIPINYINNMIEFFRFFDRNQEENNDIIRFHASFV